MIGWMRPSNASTPAAESDAVKRRATPEMFFLRRLYRLVELSERPDLDVVQRRQLNHALYSTYWDRVGLGMRDKATAILELPPQRRSIVMH